MKVDLNSDLGESFGRFRVGADEEVMRLITSANVACGYHAGDPLVMDRTVGLAAELGVALGAHPGLPDLMGFGRRSIQLSSEEAETYVLYQVAALAGFARAAQLELTHVKPHGALYNMAARDRDLACAVVRGVSRFDPELILVGLAGSELVEAAAQRDLRVAREGFADRAYNSDGSLRSRRLADAVIADPDVAAERAVTMVRDGVVVAHNGEEIRVRVDTICLHGDTPAAIAMAKTIRRELAAAGIDVRPMGSFVKRRE